MTTMTIDKTDATTDYQLIVSTRVLRFLLGACNPKGDREFTRRIHVVDSRQMGGTCLLATDGHRMHVVRVAGEQSKPTNQYLGCSVPAEHVATLVKAGGRLASYLGVPFAPTPSDTDLSCPAAPPIDAILGTCWKNASKYVDLVVAGDMLGHAIEQVADARPFIKPDKGTRDKPIACVHLRSWIEGDWRVSPMIGVKLPDMPVAWFEQDRDSGRIDSFVTLVHAQPPERPRYQGDRSYERAIVNARYLADALALAGEACTIRVGESREPVTVYDHTGEWLAVIMPRGW
jgi:hypothetical protein